MAIPNCRDVIVVKAFIKRLIPDTWFPINLKTIKLNSFEEVLKKTKG